jgi:methionyl-tRNA formyltransferase
VHFCAGVPVLRPSELQTGEGFARLRGLAPDYLLSVHYPHTLSPEVLALPSIGALDLRAAFLPWNRGCHAPSWAILEGTPYGATLHWMAEDTDAGDIALQRPLEVRPDDSADSLHARVLDLEIELLREAVPLLASRTLGRTPQSLDGTFHRKRDLAEARRLDLGATMSVGRVLDHLRALTTNRPEEAAYFELRGARYRVRVEIEREEALRAPAFDEEPST